MEFIFLLPIVLVLVCSGFFLLRSQPVLSPFLVAGSLSLFPAIFWGIRLKGPFFGGADIGAGLILIGSSLILSPLVIFLFFKLKDWPILKAAQWSLVFLCFHIGFSLLNHWLLIEQHKAHLKKSELNCGELPIHCAIRDRKLEQLQELVAKGHELEKKDGWGRTALFSAYYSQQKIEGLNKLVSLGANVSALDQTGYPLVHYFLFNEPPEFSLADLFFDRGFDVNVLYGTHKKITLLNEAIIRKNSNIVDYLLSKKADPWLKDGYGYNACERAKMYQFAPTERLKQVCP